MEQLIPNSMSAKINKKFKELYIKSECPMCSDTRLVLVDGYVIQVLQGDVKRLKLSGKSLPTVALMCVKCGYIMQFAIGILGLAEDKEEENVKAE